MGWNKRQKKREWKQAREQAKERANGELRIGLSPDTGSGLGSGSGFNSHDQGCEMLTFLYVMGKGWALLDGEEIRMVVEKVVDNPKWTEGSLKLEERICACGLGGLVVHGKVPPEVLQKFGENLGAIMYDLFGKEKAAELQARIDGKNIQDG